MRSRFRSLIALAGAIAVATTGLVIGAGAAAQAAPPALAVEMVCGALDVRWTSDPLDDSVEPVHTVVLRNGVVVEEFTMRDTGSRRYGAVDGDIFVIRRDGERDTPPVPFLAPEDCPDPPLLDVAAEDGCSSLELTLTNSGGEPVEGLLLMTADTFPAGEALAPIASGATELAFALPNGTAYSVISGPFTLDAPIWIVGTYARPATCDPPPTTPGESAGGNLPDTGAALFGYIAAGIVLVGAGVVLLAVTRRRSARFSGGD